MEKGWWSWPGGCLINPHKGRAPACSARVRRGFRTLRQAVGGRAPGVRAQIFEATTSNPQRLRMQFIIHLLGPFPWVAVGVALTTLFTLVCRHIITIATVVAVLLIGGRSLKGSDPREAFHVLYTRDDVLRAVGGPEGAHRTRASEC